MRVGLELIFALLFCLSGCLQIVPVNLGNFLLFYLWVVRFGKIMLAEISYVR